MKRRMRWGLLVLIILFALPMAAIQAQDDNPPTVAPPPADYSEVAAVYTEMESYAVAGGEEIIDLFLSGDFGTIYNRTSADVQSVLTLEQLEAAYDQITQPAPIGEREDYRFFSVAGQRAYMARHVWGENKINVVVALNDAGEISGLNFTPVLPLPADPVASYHSDVSFRLPFDGLWYTFWGGSDALHNYHVDAAPQRHAFDFVVWKDGSTYSGDGTARTDYYAYGQPVLAPADGEVISVVDGLDEVQPQVEMDPEHPAGNHVVIQVAENEYLFIAHMQPGSIQVKAGDHVTAGQVIGLTGNSGNTSEPHIHIHLQDTPELVVTDDSGQITGLSDAQGLPLTFSNYLANGEPAELGEPLGGQFVQIAP